MSIAQSDILENDNIKKKTSIIFENKLKPRKIIKIINFLNKILSKTKVEFIIIKHKKNKINLSY
jgi:hypothetical protein